jgi:hypothetical protein
MLSFLGRMGYLNLYFLYLVSDMDKIYNEIQGPAEKPDDFNPYPANVENMVNS